MQQNAVTSNNQFNVDQGDIKVDYKPNDKDNISGRYTRSYQNNPTTNTYALLGDGYSTTPIYNTVGDWTRMINTNLSTMPASVGVMSRLNSGNSWDSGVGQFGNTLGIGNGNPAGLDGLLALKYGNSVVNNFGSTVNTAELQ